VLPELQAEAVCGLEVVGGKGSGDRDVAIMAFHSFKTLACVSSASRFLCLSAMIEPSQQIVDRLLYFFGVDMHFLRPHRKHLNAEGIPNFVG
jgi:hypothetical protein